MRGGLVAIFIGITALAAYSLGRQNAPAGSAPVTAKIPTADLAKPVAFVASQPRLPEANAPILVTKAAPTYSAAPADPDKPAASDIKRKVEAGLTSAAIAAIIVKMSRGQYYASGRPCACPDDTARNGSSCGGRSAYSRPGGAAPLCYPSDVPAAMIESYRQRQAAR